MKSKEQEKISLKTLDDKHNNMRSYSYLCKMKILFCCKKCNKILTTNSLIEKILRLKTGKICFILGDDNEYSELFEKFKTLILIQQDFKINQNSEFSTVGVNEVYCKNCKNLLGLIMKQTDDTQIFMLNKIVLKQEAMKFFWLDEFGIKPFHFGSNLEGIKNMDKLAIETEEYITQKGYQIQKFFDAISSQVKDFRDIEEKKNDFDKLGDILKYLIDKDYI